MGLRRDRLGSVSSAPIAWSLSGLVVLFKAALERPQPSIFPRKFVRREDRSGTSQLGAPRPEEGVDCRNERNLSAHP